MVEWVFLQQDCAAAVQFAEMLSFCIWHLVESVSRQIDAALKAKKRRSAQSTSELHQINCRPLRLHLIQFHISVLFTAQLLNRGNIYHLKYARNVIKISTLFVMTSSYKCCVSYFLNIKIWFFPLHISVMGYLSIHTHTLWASHRIHEDSEPVSSHKSFCSILLKQIFSPNGKREKRAKDERKGCFSPPTDSFSSRMILIMNGCPEEDEKRRRRRRRAEKRRIEREGWKEEKSGRSEAEECSPLGAHER